MRTPKKGAIISSHVMRPKYTVRSGFGLCLLARELSGSRGAALLAGLAFGFFSYRWDHAVHLQSLSTQWLPFALVFARRALREGRRSDLAGLDCEYRL